MNSFSISISQIFHRNIVVLVAQLYLTLCNPMDCRLPGSSVHGIFQSRILEWVVIPSLGVLPDPGIEPASPALAGGFFTAQPLGKPVRHNRIPIYSKSHLPKEGL